MRNIFTKICCAVMASAMALNANAQVDNVGIGTNAPDQSAVLDIQSANKGLLIPRMNINERSAIKNPATGLLIYQLDEKSGFYFYDGKDWTTISANEAKSVATIDANGWALDGNASSTANKAAATASSFIGTPTGVPINFKIGSLKSGRIFATDLAIGQDAGNYESASYAGYSNVILGGDAMKNITSGHNNVAVGRRAMLSNTIGATNVALGTDVLKNNLSGSQNVAIGFESLRDNTSGNFNFALGYRSLASNTTGLGNVAVGISTLGLSSTGSDNIGIGRNALSSVSSGSRNVGIGYETLNGTTGSGNVAIGNQAGRNEMGSDKLYIANSNTPTPLIYGDFAAKFVSIGDVPTNKRLTASTSGGYNLLVKGGILTEKVKVALASTNDWADYVFDETYKLTPLSDVELFIKENKHLPNVPSAEEMSTTGLDVAQTSKMFMEKIEELTLYMIELNKEVKALKAENDELKKSLVK